MRSFLVRKRAAGKRSERLAVTRKPLLDESRRGFFVFQPTACRSVKAILKRARLTLTDGTHRWMRRKALIECGLAVALKIVKTPLEGCLRRGVFVDDRVALKPR